jgi:hypothetical protein
MLAPGNVSADEGIKKGKVSNFLSLIVRVKLKVL